MYYLLSLSIESPNFLRIERFLFLIHWKAKNFQKIQFGYIFIFWFFIANNKWSSPINYYYLYCRINIFLNEFTSTLNSSLGYRCTSMIFIYASSFNVWSVTHYSLIITCAACSLIIRKINGYYKLFVIDIMIVTYMIL